MAELTTDQHLNLASAWNTNIVLALKHRREFKNNYDDAHRFAFESHDFIWKNHATDWKTTIPKSWEMLSIYTPMLAFKEPKRTVRARFAKREDERTPFARVSEDLLNYSAHELGLKEHGKEAVEESLLGAGVMWLEQDPHTGLVGHFHGPILDLAVDPDAETIESAWWVARRRFMPRWEAASLLGTTIDDPHLPRGDRKSVVDEILTGDGRIGQARDEGEMGTGKTNELIEVWEVWSRMGIGFRSKTMQEKYGVGRTSTVSRAEQSDQEYGENVHFYSVQGSPWRQCS